MKTHKIKSGGEYTINGRDDGFKTYCGLTDYNTKSENLTEHCLVGIHDKCTCKKCNKAYIRKMKNQLLWKFKK